MYGENYAVRKRCSPIKMFRCLNTEKYSVDAAKFSVRSHLKGKQVKFQTLP